MKGTIQPIIMPSTSLFFNHRVLNKALYEKKIFFISLSIMLIIFWVSGYNVGYHFDEMDMNNHCKANYAFYFSKGKDTSYLSDAVKNNLRKDTLLRYYGSAFDYLPVGFNKIAGIENTANEFNSRHMFNQFFAVLGILFSGLIASRTSGWRTAIITQWLLFLSPTFFGLALFDTKDIPFCTGYTASLYFIILLVEELPSPSCSTTLLLLLSSAFATSLRIAGILLIFYLLLFIGVYFLIKIDRKEGIIKTIRPILMKLFFLITGIFCLVIISSPFLLSSPVKHLLEMLNISNKFPLEIHLFFEGELITSLHLPSYFLPKIVGITVPVFIILSFVVSLFFIRKSKNKTGLLLSILFTSVFPAAYAIENDVAMYHTWRHFTFIYPGIIIITAFGLNEIMQLIQKPLLQKGFILFSLASMLHPVIWSIKNHPFEYCYFNEAEGGFKNAYHNYETDYWTISVKNEIDWIMKNEPVSHSKDTIRLVTNVFIFTEHYIKTNYPAAKIKVLGVSYKKRSTIKWDYGVFNTSYFPAEEFEREYPPYGLIHTVDVDNLPLTITLKDSIRYDLMGIKAMYEYQWGMADSLYTLYMQNGGHNNSGIFGYMGMVKAMRGDYNSAFEYGKKSIQFSELQYSGYLAIGLAYANQKKIKEAIPYINKSYMLTSKSSWAAHYCNKIDPQLMNIINARN